MFCRKCGKGVSDTIKFCPACGCTVELPAARTKTARDAYKKGEELPVGIKILEAEGLCEQLKGLKMGQELPVVILYSPAEELKKFKELWDAGVLTAEEFEAKKKQLLGL